VLNDDDFLIGQLVRMKDGGKVIYKVVEHLPNGDYVLLVPPFDDRDPITWVAKKMLIEANV